jgi:hypothetical protein
MKPANVWCRHETYTDDKTRVPTGHCSATNSNPNAANSRYLPNLSLFRRVHDSFYWSEKMKPANVWCRLETYIDDNETRVPTGHCSATKSNANRRQQPVLA